MNRNLLCVVTNLCASMFLFTGCVQKIDNPNPINPPSNEEYFNFNVNQSVTLSVDYCFANKDYVILFEVYDQNPMTTDKDGESVKKDIEPIYRAATDGEGKFTSTIPVLSALSKVWLYSDYAGTLSPVELEIVNGKINFNQNDYINNLRKVKTKAVTSNNYKYPDGWFILGDWSMHGTPDYMEADRKMPHSSVLYSVNKIFVEFNKIPLQKRYPEFFKPGLSSSIQIIKPTKVYMTFINSTASWRNTIGYFTYPTGQEPKNVSEIQRIMAFPSATQILNSGALAAGERVQLKYWDGSKYVDEFPTGISIGWWLECMSFGRNNGNIETQNMASTRFSLDHLNSDGIRRVVALSDSKSGKIVALGFEDNTDQRYNDATFYLETSERGAIDDNIPPMPDEEAPFDEDNYVIKYGTIMFEDLWPYSGDYDMNDVMIKYTSKVYKNIVGNTVYKIVDEYSTYNCGGSLQSGFGINYPKLSNDAIHSVKIEGNVPSQFMAGNILEPGQTSPTIILTDNSRNMLNKTVTVTIEFNDVPESNVIPPYNPFIIPEANKSRGKEVHLVKFQPTDKIDLSLFGTGNDGSRPKDGLYYVINRLEKQYPFALDLSSISNMPVPTEGVNIDVTYPDFRKWVESQGKTNKDWYLNPAK